MNIKEFSKAVGLSPTQVSHAINGVGRVSEETRRFVLAKMAELGYTPNFNARRVSTGRSYLISLLRYDNQVFSDRYVMQIAQAIMEPLNEHGYELVLNLTTNTKQEMARLKQRAESHSVDGTIIVGGLSTPAAYLRSIAKPHHPCVIYDHVPVENGALKQEPPAHVSLVLSNISSNAQQVAELFARDGHVRIGLIDCMKDELKTMFRSELAMRGLKLEERNVIVVDRDVESGAQALVYLMSQPNPPTAVFARLDDLAFGALREAKAMGLRVPEDLSIVGGDDLPIAGYAEPKLTTVKHDVASLARAAIDILFQMINDPGSKIAPRSFDNTLVVRDSTGPAPGFRKPSAQILREPASPSQDSSR